MIVYTNMARNFFGWVRWLEIFMQLFKNAGSLQGVYWSSHLHDFVASVPAGVSCTATDAKCGKLNISYSVSDGR